MKSIPILRRHRNAVLLILACILFAALTILNQAGSALTASEFSYLIVDTRQTNCYDDTQAIVCPEEGQAYYGQDAQHAGVQPSYVDNGDGTVTDLNTGLMWQQTPDLENKATYTEAVAGVDTFALAGYDDWRLPTIKELYSLMDFSGSTGMTEATSVPFIDTDYFDFEYGDESSGERFIDAQYWTSTEYVGATYNGDATVFGVNFADGRIKGYPRDTGPGGKPMTNFVRYVRGNPDFGVNDFADNSDGAITDLATGLMWQTGDSGVTLNWEEALDYAENLELAGYDDWRLPNAKELQSIVDYTRAPAALDPAQRGPAIDPIFDISETESWFWTGTTHVDGPFANKAVYLAFGQANGVYSGNLIDVHGAGAQRSDPKSGDPADYADGFGPQNDEIRIYNYVRVVRDAETEIAPSSTPTATATSTPIPTATDRPTSTPLPPETPTNTPIPPNTSTPTATPTTDTIECEVYDLTGDGIIDLDDITAILFNSIFSDAPYDPIYDIVPDGVIDIADINAVASRFGQNCPADNTTPLTATPTATPTYVPTNTPTPTDPPTPTATATTVSDDPSVDEFEEYTLFAPMAATTTYLIDMDGEVVHTWESSTSSGNSVYLLDNGNLLRTERVRSNVFTAGGVGGGVVEYSWDGERVWSFEYASSTYQLHHDVEVLPDGNILMIAWEYKSAAEAIAAGRDPSLLSAENALWPDHVIEVDPSSNKIVWEWHVWDHLIQDYDASKPNYGVVADHPELVDLNHTTGGELADWNHMNAIDYNAELDQILLSVHGFDEIWIIDHSTTSAEAAGHSGGNSGKGGDVLYRWGNPQTYDAGNAADQQLFAQHDAQWIESDLPGAGNILIFNNGDQRTRPFSSVVEIEPPVDGTGTYTFDGVYGPQAPIWSYVAPNPTDFFARNISGAQRLISGNTLICDGPSGTFFEVTAEGETVWEYVNPFTTQTPRGEMNEVFRAERYTLDITGAS
ncbi:MAG: DUF1566 domain-containing protein [Chloroflexi bacterium]|nr:DUF1566 domain-containing protein [Chloroflexota bacterium]